MSAPTDQQRPQAPGPRLETERLVLRHWLPADREPVAAMNADPVVMRHFAAVLDRAESDAMIDRMEAHFNRRGYGLWAVEIDGNLAGFVGLQDVPFEAPFTPAVEIGWRIAAAYWHRGYASEAATAALDYGFDQVGLAEVVSFTTLANLPSQAVMTRIGMTHDPAEDFDHPRVPVGHPMRRHVLYRAKAPDGRGTPAGSLPV